MPPPRHPNKHIRAALEYAASRGWRVEKAGPRAHNWGVMLCPGGTGGCRRGVYSTPRNPEAHAKGLRHAVDRCPPT